MQHENVSISCEKNTLLKVMKQLQQLRHLLETINLLYLFIYCISREA